MSEASPQPAPARPELIGPGRLVLVVGPSGAGKDTLMAGARAVCGADPTIVFPRRVITRRSSAAEDHDTLEPDAFDHAAQNGAFAFWWEAHGLKYGIPRSAELDICAGRTLVCNVSRGIVANVRARYARVDCVLITAPPAVLAQRLDARGRPSDGPLAQRIQRNDTFADFRADFVIDNSGAPEMSIQRLLDVIRCGSTHISD